MARSHQDRGPPAIASGERRRLLAVLLAYIYKDNKRTKSFPYLFVTLIAIQCTLNFVTKGMGVTEIERMNQKERCQSGQNQTMK